mmetsp:Transcript_48328/g.55812  ORF Transcript_48328/g.55812 Transcript_48328/m.55812 type:complete len:481 (-) Transcript_48328:11-1453(-)
MRISAAQTFFLLFVAWNLYNSPTSNSQTHGGTAKQLSTWTGDAKFTTCLKDTDKCVERVADPSRLNVEMELQIPYPAREDLACIVTVDFGSTSFYRELNITKKVSVAQERGLFDEATDELADQIYALKNAYFDCVTDTSAVTLPQLKDEIFTVGNVLLPVCAWNSFWVIDSEFVAVNETSTIHISLGTVALWKFAFQRQIDSAFVMHHDAGTMTKKDVDEMKRIFVETNPWLLGLTCTVSMLHLLFEYLAFSNDVQFWKGRKNLEGLSVRSVAINCYFSTVIFLYLLDGETSWSVVIPSGIGVLIEYWKLRKCVTVTCSPKFHIAFNHSYSTTTSEHDDNAVRLLLKIMFPCLAAYSVYSAVFDTHKGWYSFLIGVQVRFIYFFGFAMMTPQIFINYKLKSVTHLPWRTFVYKALNTFIDDLFAFIIKMPTMHRLACFRDDIVFLILLYQRYIYRVDKSRTESEESESVEHQIGDKEKSE